MAIIPSEVGKNISIDTPQKQKAKKLTMVLVAVAILMALIIYFGFFSGSNTSSVDPTSTMPSGAGALPGMAGAGQISAGAMEQINQSNKIFEDLSKATLDGPIFKDKRFQALVLSDRLPVVIGEKGRQNPFAPF